MNANYIASVILVCGLLTILVNKKCLGWPYLLGLTLLPSFANIIMGTYNVWGTDLLSIVLLPLLLLRGAAKAPFKPMMIDLLLPLMVVCRGLSLFLNGADFENVYQQSVRWFSPYVFPYFVGRMACSSWEGVRRLVSTMIVICVFLSGLTIFEGITGVNALNSLFNISINPDDIKWGFFRSRATFASPHILGMWLGVLFIMSVCLFFSSPKHFSLMAPCFIIIGCGVFISTSATGLMLAIIGLAFLPFYVLRGYWRVWLSLIVAWNLFVHFASKDGITYFYARRLSFMGTAFYRARLFSHVPVEMSGNWLFGLGNSPVHVPPWSYEDICVHWLWILVRTGLLGFLCFTGLMVAMMLRIRECYSLVSEFRGERIFVWGILSSVIAIFLAWFFIALFGSDINLFAFYIGFVISLPDLAKASLARQHSPAGD